MTQFPTTIDELQDVLRGRRKLPPTRIGRASVGRILLLFMHHILSVCLPAEVMQSTMRAVYTYLITPELSLDENVDTAIFTAMQIEIDLSVARSEKARARAALRKAARLAATAPTPVPEPAPEPTLTPTPATTSTPETKPEPEQTPTPKPEPSESPAPARTKVRKKAADPDAPAFTYRYPAEKPPKCWAINEDEEESAPYDPYGIRAGIKRQTRYGTPVRPHNW